MPTLSSISVMKYTTGTDTFSDALGPLHYTSAPTWFGLTNNHTMTWNHIYTVDNTADVGVYTIQLYDYLDVYQGDIVVTITAAVYNLEFTTCIGTLDGDTPLDNPPTVEGDYWVVQSGPSWFALNGTPGAQGCEFVPSTEGAHIVVLQANEPGYENYFLLILITATQCFVEYDVCERRVLNIVWANHGGGRESYVFSGKNVYGLEIGGSEEYEDENNILRLSEVTGVRDGMQVVSGFIEKSHVIYLKLLKACIQAWIWEPLTDTFTPIVIKKESFDLYEVGSNKWKYNFTLVYGEKIIIPNG